MLAKEFQPRTRLTSTPLPLQLSPSLLQLAAHRSGRPFLRVQAKRQPTEVTEADFYVGIDPSSAADSSATSSSSPQTTTPWFISWPAGFLAVFAVLRTLGALSRRRDRSLEERGYKRGGSASEDSYAKAIKGMKRIDYEELSDDQLEAARRRRRQEIQRDGGAPDLDTIELPENHPFAVKQQISAEEEEMQKLRFSAKRGLSAEDMRMLKQQQALATLMEEEQEAMIEEERRSQQ